MADNVSTVLQNIDNTILTDKKDVTRRRRWIVAVGDPETHNNTLDNFYVIGVMQNFNTGSGRPIIEHGEIGSDYTITSIGLTAHNGRIDRLQVKGGSVLYAMHYPRCKLTDDYNTVQNLISDYNPDEPSVDGKQYKPNDLVGGTDIILGVTDIDPEVGYINPNDIRAVAVVQGINISSNANVMNIPEMGTNDTYIVSSKGNKSMFFSRIMAKGINVLAEIYKDKIPANEMHLYNTEFCDLSKVIYRYGVQLVLVVRDTQFSLSTPPQDIIVLTEALPQQWGTGKAAGERVRAENVGWVWQKTRYMNMNITKNTAPGDLSCSNLWVDLDREFIREPVDMLLISEPQEDLEEGITPTNMILIKDALIESIARSYTAQSTTTVEGLTLRWSKIQPFPL